MYISMVRIYYLKVFMDLKLSFKALGNVSGSGYPELMEALTPNSKKKG